VCTTHSLRVYCLPLFTLFVSVSVVEVISYILLLTSFFLLITSYFLLLTSYFLLLTSYFSTGLGGSNHVGLRRNGVALGHFDLISAMDSYGWPFGGPISAGVIIVSQSKGEKAVKSSSSSSSSGSSSSGSNR